MGVPRPAVAGLGLAAWFVGCIGSQGLRLVPTARLDGLRRLQEGHGGRLRAGAGGLELVESFFDSQVPAGMASEALWHAMQTEGHAVLFDRSSFGVLELSGADRAAFLHGQCTNDISNAGAGALLEASFTTPTGRAVDLCTVAVGAEALRVLVSPERRRSITDSLDKHIFPMDRVTLTDVTERTAVWSLVGPGTSGVLAALGAPSVKAGTTVEWKVVGSSVDLLGVSGLAEEGVTLVVPEDAAAELWERFARFTDAAPTDANEDFTIRLGGSREWETFRVLQGRPAPGKELTDQVTPLEVGLFHTVHFNKGCYLGQETLSKVLNQNAMRQFLWGAIFEDQVEAGDKLVVSGTGERAGVVTSALPFDAGVKPGCQTLVLLKKSMGGPGLEVKVEARGGITGQVHDIPFATRDVSLAAAPPRDSEDQSSSPADDGAVDEKTAEDLRKEAKLKAMQAKLDAFKKKKK